MVDRRVMLVTGAGRGIGAALLDNYTRSGRYHVIGCSRGTPSSELQHYFRVDLADADGVRAMFREIRATFGRLDILVNNAGLYLESHLILTPPSAIESVFRTNVFGAIACIAEAAKIMKRQRFGRIVNISSVAVTQAASGTSAYSASKAALEQYGRVAAAELSAEGITVNSLRLSVVTGVGMAAAFRDDVVARTVAGTVTGRGLELSDIVRAVDSLIEDEAAAVSGQVIAVG